MFFSLKLIFKPELISAKESNVCSIPSIMTRTHLLSEMYHQHIGISYTLYHQLSLLFRIIIPKMPIQHCWCWINIKQNPRWMLLYAMFLDEEDELIKLLWYNKWSYLYYNLHVTHYYKIVSVLSCVTTWHITMRLYLCCQGFWMPTRSPLYPATVSWACMVYCSWD